ncbi:sigma-70 family RNA polymerase sigma factor [bacterium]|jgi:RNA polymerase sigma factor (sigma-70 family)|nr:sigma-70 family RNA polymerase sigma factor [bacterium]MDB4796771.1 sigma-70 family RNA polymerase sigma factor [bacterium]
MEESEIDVESTLKRVQSGDEDAASELLEYMNPLVMKIVWRRCPVAVAEEDMAQEIFIRVFKNLNQFRGTAHFKHWVSRIAVNTCITYLIKAKSRQKELRKADLSEEQQAVIDASIGDDKVEAPGTKVASLELLGLLLGRLDPKDRMIIELKELEQKSVKEISRITGWSGVNVRVRAMRAKAKLRIYWAELLESEKR